MGLAWQKKESGELSFLLGRCSYRKQPRRCRSKITGALLINDSPHFMPRYADCKDSLCPLSIKCLHICERRLLYQVPRCNRKPSTTFWALHTGSHLRVRFWVGRLRHCVGHVGSVGAIPLLPAPSVACCGCRGTPARPGRGCSLS